ncbi:hypothetical protein FNQ90_02585 [Streptomyces alkaliphilus]|uniref:Uncharacterized protein n=1 Tax=Streptomyces alkaliphilus TaxID=1472722 RepID=A0A7W3TA59_9ACTN|nr:hypothetical protein [Streptomyces alkaliphilus]MBB0243023.1 hypothetical protein [Streptomyces alkaliphilus]
MPSTPRSGTAMLPSRSSSSANSKFRLVVLTRKARGGRSRASRRPKLRLPTQPITSRGRCAYQVLKRQARKEALLVRGDQAGDVGVEHRDPHPPGLQDTSDLVPDPAEAEHERRLTLELLIRQ